MSPSGHRGSDTGQRSAVEDPHGIGTEKEEFRRLMVIFLTAIDFLTFGYYILLELIDAEMLIFSLWFIPAVLLGFLAGSFAFGRVSEERFRRLTLGITLSAGAFLLWSIWG